MLSKAKLDDGDSQMLLRISGGKNATHRKVRGSLQTEGICTRNTHGARQEQTSGTSVLSDRGVNAAENRLGRTEAA